MAVMAAVGAGLSALSMGMSISQRRNETKLNKRMKALNDRATLTSYANAQARARAAKYDVRDEARVAYQDIIKRRMQNEGRAIVQAAVTGITGTSVTDTLLAIKRGEQEAFLSVEQGVDANIESIDNQMRKGAEQVDQALRSGQVLDLTTDLGDVLSMTTSAMYGWGQFGGSFTPTPTVDTSFAPTITRGPVGPSDTFSTTGYSSVGPIGGR